MNKHTWADGPERWRQGTAPHPPGTTAICANTGRHSEHIWVEPGRTVPLLCKGVPWPVTQYPLHSTPEALDGLAEQVADMLDNAMHLEACWISEDETRCVCLIAALRAALPRCGHVENIGVKGLTRQCLSTVHPSAAYKHVFGTV